MDHLISLSDLQWLRLVRRRRAVVMQGGWGKIDRSSRSSLWMRL